MFIKEREVFNLCVNVILYLDEINLLYCTFTSGAKYEFAKKWRINIVKSDWLYDSIEKGYCLEEKQFSLTDNSETKAEVKTSTPEKDNGPRGNILLNIYNMKY